MSTDPLIGKQFGSYELKELLGRGGMAAVYLGYQASIDRSVAVKVLPAELLADPHFLTRFLNEARTLARLTHPSILPLYDFGEAHGMPYIVMPLMTRGTLADRLQAGSLSLDETVRIITAVAQALDFANKQGILHRDIKPNNILFDQHDNPYLADFGIAKATESSTSLTGTGIIGTPDYMSPEQARGDPLDHRSDLYSLGVVAYQCLTGHQLFRATTPMGVIFKHVSEAPRPLRDLRPDLPEAVDRAVLKALSKTPADRYASASDFARALSRAAAEALATPPSVGTAVHEEAPTEAMPEVGDRSWSTSSVAPEPTSTVRRPTLSGAAGAASASAFSLPAGPAAPAKSGPNWLLIGGGAAVAAALCCGLIFVGLPALGLLTAGGATATPAVQALFQDDFESPLDSWSPFDDGEVSRSFEAGQYVFRSSKTNWFSWDTSPEPLSNVRVEVTARSTGAEDASFGLMCAYQDGDNYYYAGIDVNGYYAIIRTQAGEDFFLTDASNQQWLISDAIATGAESYQLALECGGGDLVLSVDGTVIASVQDDTFDAGQVGLFLSTFEQPDAEVWFDDFIAVAR